MKDIEDIVGECELKLIRNPKGPLLIAEERYSVVAHGDDAAVGEHYNDLLRQARADVVTHILEGTVPEVIAKSYPARNYIVPNK